MAVKTRKTLSNVAPDDLYVKKIGNKYEIMRAKNIDTIISETEDGPEELYQYDLIIRHASIFSRDHAVGVFVELEYSKDDEMSMINKGIAEKSDLDYIEYREYVEWCKEQADVYFNQQ